ncbi:MAG: V-type ATPase subunit [Christensenellaceae bacterium]|jgi:V/A-type H+-transporting ATPase subunit C|nr:V-type ATPase subunit [Christensenellaceae bacterium]
MPQSSAIYGISRIRCHEKDLLGRDRLQRMIEGSGPDALRQLLDVGYGGMPDATLLDAERMVANEVDAAYTLAREVSFAPTLTDVFLMKADVHNLKLLLKLRLTQGKEAPALMQGGVYDPGVLKHMVETTDYRGLPDIFRGALDALEQSFAGGVDPARISTALDGAYVQYAYDTKDPFVVGYFKARADFDNVLILLRMRAMHGDAQGLRAALLPAGEIPHSRLAAALEAPIEGVGRLIATGSAREGILRAFEALGKGEGLHVLERERDNYLIRKCAGAKFDNESIAPVIGYVLAREQEALCVRLVLTAKRNGLLESVITERLRELYG